MMNNLLSFTGYQDGGVVWDDDTPTWEDVKGEMGVYVPESYEQWKYEYDPAGEEYLKGKYGRAEEKSALDIGEAYRGMTSGFRDIASEGRSALAKMRTPSKGGFAGGGDLLGMTTEDLYSEAAAKRGGALEGYKGFQEGEEHKLEGLEAGAKEDIRVKREDYEVESVEHMMDLQDMYGEDFESYKKDDCGTYYGVWMDGAQGWNCYQKGSGGEKVQRWNPNLTMDENKYRYGSYVTHEPGTYRPD